MICRSCQGEVHGAYILSYDFLLYSMLGGQAWMDEAVWTEYMDRPITPPNRGGQGTNRLLWPIMHMQQRISALMQCLRSPNCIFLFPSLLFYSGIFISFFRLQPAGDLCESGQWRSEQGPAFIQVLDSRPISADRASRWCWEAAQLTSRRAG